MSKFKYFKCATTTKKQMKFDFNSAIKNQELFPIIRFISKNELGKEMLDKPINPLIIAKNHYHALSEKDKKTETGVNIHKATKSLMIYYALFIHFNEKAPQKATLLIREDLDLISAIGKSFIRSAFNTSHEFAKMVAPNNFEDWSFYIIKKFIKYNFFDLFEAKVTKRFQERFRTCNFSLLTIWYLSDIYFNKDNVSKGIVNIYNFMIEVTPKNKYKNEFMSNIKERYYLIKRFNIVKYFRVWPFLPQDLQINNQPDHFEWYEAAEEPSRVSSKQKKGKKKKHRKPQPLEKTIHEQKQIRYKLKPAKPKNIVMPISRRLKYSLTNSYIEKIQGNIIKEPDYKKKCEIFYQNMLLLSAVTHYSVDLTSLNKVFGFRELDVSGYTSNVANDFVNLFVSALIRSTLNYLAKSPGKRTGTNRSVMAFVIEACSLLRIDIEPPEILVDFYNYLCSKSFDDVYLVGGLASLMIQRAFGLVQCIDMAEVSDIDLVIFLDDDRKQTLLNDLAKFNLKYRSCRGGISSVTLFYNKMKVDIVIYKDRSCEQDSIDSKKSFTVSLSYWSLINIKYRDIALLVSGKRFFNSSVFEDSPRSIAYYLRECAKDKSSIIKPEPLSVLKQDCLPIKQGISLYLTKYVYENRGVLFKYFTEMLLPFIPEIKIFPRLSEVLSSVLERINNKQQSYNYLPFTLIVVNKLFRSDNQVTVYHFPKKINSMAEAAVKSIDLKNTTLEDGIYNYLFPASS